MSDRSRQFQIQEFVNGRIARLQCNTYTTQLANNFGAIALFLSRRNLHLL
ncbi:hypothetical protein IQ272_13780 [Chroococcidiopsidales cyanobacterium LEGE 13417]|nr:hypothetical protein [Chroococcidiopsidales cyanobacterium LEGE 13417]